MRRRQLLSLFGVAGGSLFAPPQLLAKIAPRTGASGQATDDELPFEPYFLDRGELTAADEAARLEFERAQQNLMKGKPAVIPRSVLERRVPTYRVVHWQGELNDSQGVFVSPLQVKPALPRLAAYRVNAQILGFHGARDDWRGKSNQGALTVEIRGRMSQEPVTWLFAQPFDMDGEGYTNLGSEYIAQRNGSPDPVLTDEPNIGLRIQLMRQPRKAGGLRKLVNAALILSGVPVSMGDPKQDELVRALPPLRVPSMLPEAVALSQAVFGGTAEEAPIWRGGFSSYGIGEGGSRLALAPGYWMVIDGSRELDLRGVVLKDIGGVLTPARGERPLDANYLVLGLEIEASDGAAISKGAPRP